ncbi:Hypothetical predicted protein [Marmota monax]|uniref:G-protein coupled receptors family 1 profile domain-containing protein n=1 Tax=Marmota monax TaxID=9995 RepID=A0A5E4CKF2_MARMO|nr:Hypothetical predicted protein [Marmota monax]
MAQLPPLELYSDIRSCTQVSLNQAIQDGTSEIFFLLTLGGGECFLFAAMSYDCYVAICHPLHYPMIMSWPLCLRMTMGSWFLGAADGLMQAVVALSFPFCSRREIDHFFCEAPTLLCLACADTSVFEDVMYICCVLMLLVPFCLILTSYSLILAAVLHMRSPNCWLNFLKHSQRGRCGNKCLGKAEHPLGQDLRLSKGTRQGGCAILEETWSWTAPFTALKASAVGLCLNVPSPPPATANRRTCKALPTGQQSLVPTLVLMEAWKLKEAWSLSS